MSVFATYPFGNSEDINDVSESEKLYAEKNNGDDEHFGVDLISGDRVLALNSGGALTWENPADERHKLKHLNDVSKEKVSELRQKLFHGQIDEINSESRIDGY